MVYVLKVFFSGILQVYWLLLFQNKQVAEWDSPIECQEFTALPPNGAINDPKRSTAAEALHSKIGELPLSSVSF